MISRAETRDDILRRFEAFLDTTLAREEPPQGIPNEMLDGGEGGPEASPADLYTMWAAMTALTQEVKLQGRAFKQLNDTFKQLNETLAREAERRSRKEVLDALLDLRERLVRGIESVAATEELLPSFWDRIFRKRWEQIQRSLDIVRSLEKGYRLSLESLNDLLERFNVRPIRCEGQPFNPRVMSAIDVEETAGAAEGTVLSVYRTGYEWNGEVYRPAQVKVARRLRNTAINE